MINKIRYTFIYSFLFIVTSASAQNIAFSKEVKANLDKDIQVKLFPALDSLVGQIRDNNINEALLQSEDAAFNKAIFGNIRYYETSYKDSLSKTSTSLLNVYSIGEGRYLNQLAYYKESEHTVPSLQMLVNIVAHIDDKKVTFSTPLNYYTKAWKKQKVGSISYFYRDSLRLDRAETFAQKNILFSSRFKKQPQGFRFFMVENYQELLRLLGFDYNIATIGQLRDGYGVIASEVIFSVMGNEDFSHDLFHFYSGTVHKKRSGRNWVTEEGLAYSWGNAYYTRTDGEMAEQAELVGILKDYLAQNKETDLFELFMNNFWRDKSGIYEHLAPDFKVGRLISSLICDEVYRKHGMDGLNTLIASGSKPNQFTPFFEATDKLIGVNKKNFNRKVNRLIKRYGKNKSR